MKYIIILIFSSTLLLSCTQGQKQEQKKRRIQKDGYIMEGNIESDSTFQGVINYYDINTNKLVYQATFLNNVENGLAINYYQNGMKKDEVNFVLGKEYGAHIIYDTTGKIISKNYYYYGRKLGPDCIYKEDGSIKEYYFADFEGKVLLYYSYDDPPTVQQEHPEKYFPEGYFNMNTSYTVEDGVLKMKLFLYIIQLPKHSFRYSICKDSNDLIVHIKDIPNNEVFYQTTLPILTGKQNYCVGLNIFDSTTQKKLAFAKDAVVEGEIDTIDNRLFNLGN